MGLSKYEQLIEYFEKVLKDPTPMVYMATVTKLIRLFEDDTDNDFRNTAAAGGLVRCLTDFLTNLPSYSDNQKENDASLNIPAMAVAGLRCLYLMCSVRPYYHKQFVNLSFANCLLRYASPKCDPSWQPFGCFYQFGPIFTEKLKDLLSSCDSLKVMSNLQRCANVQKEFAFYEPKLAQVLDILKTGTGSITCKYVELRGRNSSSPDTVLNINEELIQQELAWKKCPEPGEPSPSSSSNLGKQSLKTKSGLSLDNFKWRDCSIDSGNVLNGNFMWALLDKEAIEMSELISESLQEKAAVDQLKRVKPNVGDLVVAGLTSSADEAGPCSYVRARVSEIGGGIVTVFAVDQGTLSKVPIHSVYGLPQDLNMEEFPATVSLVRLKGVSPLPLDVRVTEMALACFMMVCKPNYNYRMGLFDLGIMHQLPELIISSDAHVKVQSLRLAAMIVTTGGSGRVPFTEKWLRVIYATLVNLNECVDDLQKMDIKGVSTTSTERIEVMMSCLTLLNNRLYLSKKAKQYFYQMQGVDIVARVLALVTEDRVREMGAMVLNNYIHITKMPEGYYLPSALFAKTRGGRHAPEYCIRKKPKPIVSTGVLGTIEAVGLEEDQDDYDDYIAAADDSTPPTSHLQEDTYPDPESSLNKGEVDYYEFGSSVPFRSDGTHELFQISGRWRIWHFANIICGMLNTGKGGSLYLGISAVGVVEGEQFDHNERDELRLGVDNLMMKFSPIVLHSQYTVKCSPVVKYVGEGEQRQRVGLSDKHVVEISVKSAARMFYCFGDTDCYYRYGTKTISLSPEEVHKMVVLDEEELHMEEMSRLRRKLDKLKMEEAAWLKED